MYGALPSHNGLPGGERPIRQADWETEAMAQRIRNLETDPQNDRVSVDNCGLRSERDAGGKYRFVLPSAAFG